MVTALTIVNATGWRMHMLYEQLTEWDHEKRRKYLESRKYKLLEKGILYPHCTLQSHFYCIRAWMTDGIPCAELVNETSGWCFTAHGTLMYLDGAIEWDYSMQGYHMSQAAVEDLVWRKHEKQ